MFQVFLQDIYLEAANRLSSLNLKQDLAVGVLLVIYIFTWYQCLINKCSKCYEPRAFAPPLVLCANLFFVTRNIRI